MNNAICPANSEFEISAFEQKCRLDGVLSYHVQAKKPELTLHLVLKLPAYDNPARVTQRRKQLVNIAEALVGGGGYLPAIVEVGLMEALVELAPQFRFNEPYILLERPIGVPLSTINEPFSQEDAATLIIRVAQGVDALHKAGWIHGSLAPNKIYVALDRAFGTLAHFGTVMHDGKVTDHLIKSQHKSFSAPEIQTQKKVTKQIDIYALGMLLYRLLVGEDPLPHAINKASPLSRLVNTIFKVEQKLAENVHFPKINRISEKLVEVIYKATAWDQNTRYSSVLEFIEAVGKAFGWTTAKFSLQKSKNQKGLLSEGEFIYNGRYQIKGVFASGNQGVIYEAWKMPCDTGFPNIPVLIKCTQYHYQNRQEVGTYIFGKRIQIEHEAKMAQRLHRFVGVTPQPIDFFYDQTHDPVIKARAPSLLKDEPYFVMSKIAASCLGNIEKPEPNFAIRIGRRLAEALVTVHARKVLYQDIKPENILVDAWGSAVFLVDLGAVCPVINGKLQENSPGYGNLTPGYQAPEFDDLWQNTDYRFDIYSLGATLFFLLTGICPLYDLYVPEFNQIEKNKNQLGAGTLEELTRDAERPFLEIEKLPASVRPVIAQLVERNRNKRCPNAETAVNILKHLERQLSGYPIPAPIIRRAEYVEPVGIEIECEMPHDIAISHIVLKRMDTLVNRYPCEKIIILRDDNPLPGVISYKIQAETELDKIICLTALQQITYAPPLKVNLIEKPGTIIVRWEPISSAKSYVVLRHNNHMPENLRDGIQICEKIVDTTCRFIEDKMLSPNQTYFYAVIAQYQGNIYSPPAGGAATPRPLPVAPHIIDWTSNPETCECVIYWQQTEPLPDYYIIKEFDETELNTFKYEPKQLEHTINTRSGEKRWIRIASRIMDVYSSWRSILVAGYVPVNELRAEAPQAERAILNWQAMVGIFYQIERQTGEIWQKIGRVKEPPFFDENIVPGEYHYRVQALMPLNPNEYHYFGSATVKAHVLEAVPLPDVQFNLQDNVLTLVWQFNKNAQKISGVQISCDTEDKNLYSGKIEDSNNLVLPDLPIGIQVTIRVWGVFGEERSPRPLTKWIVPTAPVEALMVETFIEKTKLSWKMPPNVDYCVIYRQSRMSTTTISERCHDNFLIDADVPTGIEVTYQVKPIFQNGVIGNAKSSETVIVPPQPQVPQNIYWLQENQQLSFKWQLPPDMRYISGWQIVVLYKNFERKREVPRNTTFVTITKLPPWVPIYVEVRALVGSQVGELVTRSVGGITENSRVNIKASINEVNLQWNPPPLMGKLIVNREGGEKTVQFVVPAKEKFYVDFPSKLNTEYLYSYYFELEHPEIGTLRTTPSLPQKVFPRTYPVNTEAPIVGLHPDGQQINLTWLPESKHPSVDSYLYLRKIGTEPFPSEPFEINQLASLIQQKNVTTITTPKSDYISHLGITCQYARVAINTLAAVISPAASVTSIPPVKIESVHFGKIQTTLIVKKLPVWQVILRREASNVPDSTPCMLLAEKATSPQSLLKTIAKKLQGEREGIQLLPPGTSQLTDISVGQAFRYHLLSLVKTPNKCFISACPHTSQSTEAGLRVIYEFSKLNEVWYWAAVDLLLKWTFQLTSGKTIVYTSTQTTGKFLLPETVKTVQIVTQTGEEIIGENIRDLPIEGKQILPERVNLWLAQQWFQINRYLITTEILAHAELLVQQINPNKIKVTIPKELGDGHLLFIAKSQKNRPVVQVFRTHSWRLRTRVVDIFCDKEPWLKINGLSMQRILESVKY